MDRLLVDLGADARVSVSTWPDGQPSSPAGEPFELVWPLDAEALEDLRWYLEDYLLTPYGVYGERGPQIAGRLTGWGQAAFAAVFGTGAGRNAYAWMQARAGKAVEIMFRSSSAGWLGLPWELLCDPVRPTPMALDGIAVSRSLLATAPADASTVDGKRLRVLVDGKRLRVLMVISRPGGAADIGYRMIARPLLERLEAVRGSVELVVLRPPTLEGLEDVLTKARDAGEPFQVVHFDGHGTLAGRPNAAGSGARPTLDGHPEQGLLTFEMPGGGPHQVPASDVARVLAKAKVPVVVLNACQSGAVGKQLEAAVAPRLLQEGAASVVAMAYTVYAVAAAEFMAAFYERLFAGDRVSDAVSAGRRRLAQRDQRPSPKGKMPLADWVVPVHYWDHDVRFPDLQAAPAAKSPRGEKLGQPRDPDVEYPGAAPAPVDAFVGRDGLFYTLEAAARHERVVVLHGQGGTGKTELAKAFGRWWCDTGGVEHPEEVIWHSFKPGLASFGLDGVVADIGLQVDGADFARLDTTERRKRVLSLLSERRLLLIWDNFETVHSMPDSTGVTPPLDAAGCAELRRFLERVAAEGKSAVLVTSRADESWLGGLRRIPVGGLAPDETIEYADQLLAEYPGAAPRRAKRAFAELMEWLDGHPLSMRVILPYLGTTDPEVLLTGLRGVVALPGGDGVLAASVAYSIDHLPTKTRRLLVAVSLFQGVVYAAVLAYFSRLPDVPQRFRGHSMEDWTQVLDEAAGVGLLTGLENKMYGIHPALPAFLADQWRIEEPFDYDQQQAAAQAALLEAHAAAGNWLVGQIQGGNSSFAFAVIEQQLRTLSSLLGYALERGQWEQARNIAPPLFMYWAIRRMDEEAQGWVDRVRLALETADGTPLALDDPAGALWLFFLCAQGKLHLGAHQLDAAERIYLEARDMLERQPESPYQVGQLAITYHILGMVAQERGHADDAEGWYLKSLTISEKLSDWPRIAESYHQLGIVAMLRGCLDKAEGWQHKSLLIFQKLDNWPGMAKSYHLLGGVAQHQGHLDAAEKWYRESSVISEELGDRTDLAASYYQLGVVAQLRENLGNAESWHLKSLTISEELSDRTGIAKNYHQLGIVAQLQGNLGNAESWHLKSLTISEELSDRIGMAHSYHELGMVAQQRGNLDAAEDWCQQSLAISEALGNRPSMATNFVLMGLLAEVRGRPEKAMEWTVRCVTLFDEFPHPTTGTGATYLVSLTTKLGIDSLDRCWHRVTGKPAPRAVREFIALSLPETAK